MKLISLAKLHAAKRKPGYIEAVMAVAEPVSNTHIRVTAEDFERLRQQYALDVSTTKQADSAGHRALTPPMVESPTTKTFYICDD